MSEEVPQRLQKVLAQRGLGSRREIERWIEAGKVLVNGEPAVLGTKVSASDKISIDGHNVQSAAMRQRVILYNKPIGEVCTRSDPEGRITVFERLPELVGQRWINIGRLDINSAGLILFTTDGDLANKLMHPKANIEREYAVRILGPVTEKILRNVTTGVTLDDGTFAKFESANFVGGKGANLWYDVTLKRGLNREVRRIWESQGLQVSRLIRIRYGNIKLPKDLAEGRYIELNYESVKAYT